MHAPSSRCAPFPTTLMMSILHCNEHPGSVTTLIRCRPMPGSSIVAQSNDGSCAGRHSLPLLTALARYVQEPRTPKVTPAPPSPLSHPAPGKNNIIPSRNDNAANNFILMCQPIKNEVA
ncbi:hypothetical protein SMDB11_4620 [Serratia marcescens subsp. marcescens Db11]|uniref:Uncharacterized protein n=1 Tax=Serratia marcescens subsp. marcescens Db11 TaxID=273526 RepID=A0ABC9IQQ5_SERMA|nr:hypothetical protein SMDB11_4620 [Serratia marcescens subsp. marcescens Db11]